MQHKAIFFDRDGTLIVDKVYLNDPGNIVYLDGVFEALRRLRDSGFKFVIVTNQSGMAKGLVQIENLDRIHDLMREEFARHGIFFSGFYYAPYTMESNHPMRKPNPGMLTVSAQDFNIDLSRSWIVGDRMTDVEAGHRAGVRSVLLEGVDTPTRTSYQPPTGFVPDILSAAEFILRHEKR